MAAPCDVAFLADTLWITPRGWHKFLSLKRSLDIPYSAVESVEARLAVVREEMRVIQPMELKVGPSIGKAYKGGTFRQLRKQDGSRITTWWLVRNQEETITLNLSGFKYHRAIVEVDGPDGVVDKLRSKIGEGTAG